MSLQAYLRGCNRGDFQWECTESGTYGEGNSIDVECVQLKGRCGSIKRCDTDSFEAEVDDLKSEPF